VPSAHPLPLPSSLPPSETDADRAAAAAWAKAEDAEALYAAVAANGGVIPPGLPARFGEPYELLAPPPEVDPFAIPEDDEEAEA
jgi:hypothetical protein